MKKIKNTEGITLIALVVTIVVLLILASISVHSLKGDNGVIKQAKKAKHETEFARENEVIGLAKVEVSKKDQELTKDTLQKALDQIEGIGKTIVDEGEDSDELKITFIDTKNVHNEELTTYEISEEEQNYWTYEDNEDGTITLLNYNPPAEKLPELTTLIVPNKLYGKKVKSIGSNKTEELGIWGANTRSSAKGERYGCGWSYYQETIKKVVIQRNIDIIERNAFWGGIGVQEVVFEGKPSKIGNYAFYKCQELKKIDIPSSVQEIGYGAFSYCSGLESITVDKMNSKYDSRYSCNAIIETETNTLIAGCVTTIIPNDIINIGVAAFYGCTRLNNAIVPEGIKKIEERAYAYCENLESIEIASSVNIIQSYALIYCNNLTKINIKTNEESNLTIENNGISFCYGLKTINIPKSVVKMEESAIRYCKKLETINIEAASIPEEWNSRWLGESCNSPTINYGVQM